MDGPRRMADARLDIGSLEKAVDRLREGFDRYQRDITDTQIRDGRVVVQRANGEQRQV